MTYPLLGLKGLAALASLTDIASSVYNSVEAKELTLDAGIDIGGDVAELGFLFQGIETLQEDSIRGAARYANVLYAIVYATLNLITALEFLNGFGLANTGSVFLDGKSRFGAIHDDLASADAYPNEWQGKAAAAYEDQNHQQQTAATNMATADKAMADIMQRQAAQVEKLREELAATKLALSGLLMLMAAITGRIWELSKITGLANAEGVGVAADLEANEAAPAQVAKLRAKATADYLRQHGGYAWVEPAVAFLEPWLSAVVLVPCIGALTAAGVFVGRLIEEGNSNAQDVKDQIAAYQKVAADLAKVSTGTTVAAVGVPAASPSTVSGFSDIYLMPGTSKVPEVGAAPVGAFTGAHESRRGGSSAVGIPQPQTPATNMAGHIPQLASTARRAAAAPAEVAAPRKLHLPEPAPAVRVEAALAEDGEGAEASAASGVEHAQAVPIEIATPGAQPEQEPTPTGVPGTHRRGRAAV